jgi:hypothetical protein
MENACSVEKIVARFGHAFIIHQNLAIRPELPT